MRVIKLLWLFFMPFCFMNLTINIFAVTGRCLHRQESALLHLKNSLIFNPAISSKLVHWNQSDDCCKWNGVTCTQGRVTGLDLSEESISGGLDSSSSLYNLQYLQKLNLAYNGFHSGVPPELHKMRNLRYLNLSNAGFTGQIPVEISYLTKLVFLDLSASFTSLHGLKLENPNIRILLQNLTEIKELYLDGVRIFAEGREWGQALSSLQNLRVLSMSFCNLSGPIDSSLAKLQSLLKLRLNQNNMASSVPQSFVSLTNLTTLQMRSCNLSGVFPKNIFKIPNLHVLDMSDNHDLHGSLPNFQVHASLQTLNLSHTNFSGKLPNSIHNLRKLSTLDLSNCKFNGTLPSLMSELTQLVQVDLSFNNFIGPLPSFNMSKTLTYLSLYQNDLKCAIPSSHFQGLENLITIDLSSNSFTGRIPSSLFTLPSLRELMLSQNGFEGLLDEFSTASSLVLEILDVSGNNLQGPIPMSVFHLRRLTVLQLASNKFNGTIYLDMMKKMENLTILDFNHNNLLVDATLRNNHGLSSFPKLNRILLASCKLYEFPTFLRNRSNLLYLDLSSNFIHGTMPNWIWRCDFMVYLNLSNNILTQLEGPFHNISSSLLVLDLHSNQLHKTTPIFPKNVVYLDYSSNRFSNFAPLDIGNHLPFTYFLSLSNNSFRGKIHESFCNISTLRVLDLSDNSFSGTIPECLTRSSTLRMLNVGRNKLKGQISNAFSTSCALRFLDLNGNFLGGTIPKSLANCPKLQVLNLGNNQLTDRFPCFLKNMSNLRVMILRSNNLHGPLECPNSKGNWDKLQIIDLASNNFTGTLSVAFLQSLNSLTLDKDEGGSELFGHLFFDIYDNVNLVDLKSALSVVNKDVALKLAKNIAAVPPSVTNHILFDVYTGDFNGRIFQDSVTIVNKGRQLQLVKIFIAFTSLDFSSNHLEGPISEEFMSFNALHALNLSQNAFSGHIPSSIKSLKHLESLDLSMNSLNGNIPTELASLSFLAFLNLSYNHLTGAIPTGTQIQSFEANSFEGNDDLCGPPLTQGCNFDGVQGLSPPAFEMPKSNSRSSIDWNFLSAELGFTFGLGMVILPLIILKQWRMQYFKHVDYKLYKIFPQLDFVYENRGGKIYRTLRWKNI